MNRGTRGRIPITTNPTGAIGRGGRSHALGRPTDPYYFRHEMRAEI
jgi:hypothetical protein